MDCIRKTFAPHHLVGAQYKSIMCKFCRYNDATVNIYLLSGMSSVALIHVWHCGVTVLHDVEVIYFAPLHDTCMSNAQNHICISRHHLLFNFTAGLRPLFMSLRSCK